MSFFFLDQDENIFYKYITFEPIRFDLVSSVSFGSVTCTGTMHLRVKLHFAGKRKE